MQSLQLFWFQFRLFARLLLSVFELVIFVFVRKPVLLCSTLFLALLFTALVLLHNQQLQVQFQQALQLEQQELLISQIRSEIVFWEQLSQTVDSTHIWLRLADLYQVVGETDKAMQAMENARGLDPTL